MAFVVDASVVLAWCFEDEANPYTESVLDRLQQTEAVVPAIWPLEVANVLPMAECRQRLTEAQTARLVQLLWGLPITIDTEGLTQALGVAYFIAEPCRVPPQSALRFAVHARWHAAAVVARNCS